MPRSPFLLSRDTCTLVVIDAQDKLLNVMASPEPLVANLALLVQAANIVNIPVVATTQYAARLGRVTEVVAAHLPNGAEDAVDKLCFSCAGSEAFMERLRDAGRSQVLLCGLETHICVSQTAQDLLHAGYQVHVAADAVGSRTIEKHKLGMERIRDAGARPCASEAAVYEWLQQAGTPEFKYILPLVR